MEDFSVKLDSLHQNVNKEIVSFSQEIDLKEDANSDELIQEGSSRYSLRSNQKQDQANMALESEVVSKRSMLRSWKNLQRDLHDLNDTIKRFSSMVWVCKGVVIETLDEDDTFFLFLNE